MATTFLGGTLNFTIDGVAYRLGGSFSDNRGGLQRTGKVGPDGVLGYTQKYGIPMIDCELIDDGTVSLDSLGAVSNSTITVEYDNGKVVVLSNAWQEGEIVEDVIEAKIKLKFAGRVRTEVTA
jgi:hypothetical protein